MLLRVPNSKNLHPTEYLVTQTWKLRMAAVKANTSITLPITHGNISTVNLNGSRLQDSRKSCLTAHHVAQALKLQTADVKVKIF
jgi:hypothetical protein